MRYVIGLDTSCYTTSVAILDEHGQLVADERKMLDVKNGNKGLKQSEMVFQHTRNLPNLISRGLASLSDYKNKIAKICVTGQPRTVTGSYMPTFLVGRGFGEAMAKALDIPFYIISHQENHIMAGIWSCSQHKFDRLLAVHLSGGTTDILEASVTDKLFVKTVGTSLDINAGQFIDRIGVKLGMTFPCGPHLEKAAALAKERMVIPSVVRNCDVSFSGPLTQAERLFVAGVDVATISLSVQHCIAKTLYKALYNAVEVTKINEVLIVGGVASNNYLRNYLEKLRKHKINIFYAEPEYSRDNAVGAAYYGLMH